VSINIGDVGINFPRLDCRKTHTRKKSKKSPGKSGGKKRGGKFG